MARGLADRRRSLLIDWRVARALRCDAGAVAGSNKLRGGLLFTFRLIPLIAGELALRGIDARALVARAGLPPAALAGEVTAPLDRITAFVDDAAAALASSTYGLGLAARVPAGVYGISEFLVRSSPNVAVGLRALSDFAALINPIGRFHLADTPDAMELHYAVPGERDALGAHLNEYTIALLARYFDVLLGEKMPLRQVWFAHARTSDALAVGEHFGCNVRFAAPDCGLAIGRDILARSPHTANAPLFEFLLGQARAQLARHGAEDVVTQLMRVIEVRLASGALGVEQVASAMATSSRTLQRLLTEAGTSYRDVLSHVRARRRTELARAGVAEPQIATQLGFPNVYAMHRALDD
jgi:AraC-like DNA-binding protein